MFYNYNRKVGCKMRIEGSYTNAYQKENAKQVAINAASSAVLSTGLTLAFNKGQNPKNALKVGLIVAGISVVIDTIRAGVSKLKNKNTDNQTTYDKETGKLFTHQG